MLGTMQRRWTAFAVLLGALVVGGCQDTGVSGVGIDPICNLDTDLLIASLQPNAIPAINEPPMVAADDPAVEYLLDSDRVLGVVVEGEARAYPHNVFWWHEIINDRIGDEWISITFCPLTGSGLGFDPELDGVGRLDLGVSGLLFANNLVMFDRSSGDVYGPQLTVTGACDTFRDRSLTLVAVQEMSWGRWKELHPDTRVVSGDLSFNRNYRQYPYGSYDRIDNGELLMSMSVDRSRPIKERVLAIREGEGEGGKGYPFGELAELGAVVAVNETVGGVPTAVFYESADGEAALAYDARVGGQTLTFEADETNGVWTDLETGSTWTMSGEAIDGPLAGERMTPRADSYTLFWFAWRHFQPRGGIFRAR